MTFLKILFVLFLVFYLLSKLGRFIIKTFFVKVFGQAGFDQYQRSQSQRSKTVDGTLHVDHIPNKDQKQASDLGGDYVDYEDVK